MSLPNRQHPRRMEDVSGESAHNDIFAFMGPLFFLSSLQAVELSHRPPVGNCCVYKQQLLWRIRKGEAGCLFELAHSSSASPVGLQSSRGKGALQHPRLFLILSGTTWFHSVDTLRTSWFPQAAAGHLSTPSFTLHRIIGVQTRGSANWGSPPCSSEKHYKLAYEM